MSTKGGPGSGPKPGLKPTPTVEISEPQSSEIYHFADEPSKTPAHMRDRAAAIEWTRNRPKRKVLTPPRVAAHSLRCGCPECMKRVGCS